MSESVSQAGITTRLHFSGVTTTYTYDSLNRLLSRATPGEATASFAYTATGQHATMSDASGTTTYTYDTMDCLVTKATPEGTLTYTHSPVGQQASIASPARRPPLRLRRGQQHRLGYPYPNGVEAVFAYDTLNRVSALASQVSGYSYQRGPVGNLTSTLELNNRTMSWSYDGINRLTGEIIANAPAARTARSATRSIR